MRWLTRTGHVVFYDSDEQRVLHGESWQMLRDRLERNWRRGARARLGVTGEIMPTPHAMLDERTTALFGRDMSQPHSRAFIPTQRGPR